MSHIKIIRAGTLVAAHDQPAVSGGAVVVSGEYIEAVGQYSELSKQYPNAKTIGGESFLLIPGLINGHGHGRGLTDFQRGALDNTLESWILDTRKYIPVSIYHDTVISAAKLLKSGVTTSMHNHILKNPEGYHQEFEEGIKAYSDAGLRVQFNPSVRNANPFIYGDNKAFLESLPNKLLSMLSKPLPPGSLSGENFVQAVIDLHNRFDNSMSKIGFGPLGPQWCSDELLLQIRDVSKSLQVPVHLHALQSIFQKVYALKFKDKSQLQHLYDIGFLGEKVVIGHCVWPTKKEIDLLAETRTGVTHHPSCNLRLRNGIAPAYEMLQAGVRIGLGLDGKSINDDDDMIQEMKMCFLLHRLPSLELDSSYMNSREVLRMATEMNAELLGYGQELGRLEPGRYADLVLVDYQKMCHPFVKPSHDPIDVLLYRGKGNLIDTVMVNGRIVVKGGNVLTIDEDSITEHLARNASRPRTENEVELAKTMDELRHYVAQYYEGWPQKVNLKPYFGINSQIDGIL